MSEETPAPDAKTFTQDEVNTLIQDRLKRQATKFADYDELKAKVTQYEASMSTADKALEEMKAQVADLSAKAARTEREALIARVARDNGISDSEDIELFLTGDTEDTLIAQAKRLAARTDASKKAAQEQEAQKRHSHAHVGSEGAYNPAPPQTTSEDALALSIAQALGQAPAQ